MDDLTKWALGLLGSLLATISVWLVSRLTARVDRQDTRLRNVEQCQIRLEENLKELGRMREENAHQHRDLYEQQRHLTAAVTQMAAVSSVRDPPGTD